MKSLLPPKGFSLRYIISYYQEYKNMGKADKFFTRPQWFDMLVGNRKVRRQITEGKDILFSCLYADYFVILHKNKNLIEDERTCYH